MTLYDLQGEYLRLYTIATDLEDPESQEAFKNALEELDTDLANKASGYVHIIKQLEMEADECDKIVEAFRAKKEVRKNSVKRMKEALLGAMEIANIQEVKAGEYTLKIAKNGGKAPVEIPDESKVPDNFMRIKYEIDKDLIRTALEEGKEIDFAFLGERGKHLNIK